MLSAGRTLSRSAATAAAAAAAATSPAASEATANGAYASPSNTPPNSAAASTAAVAAARAPAVSPSHANVCPKWLRQAVCINTSWSALGFGEDCAELRSRFGKITSKQVCRAEPPETT